MRVTVRFFAQAKAAAGVPRRELDVPDHAEIGDVVRRVAAEGGVELGHLLIDDQDQIHETILLFVGEDPVPRDEPRRLKDGDVIDVMPPISGG